MPWGQGSHLTWSPSGNESKLPKLIGRYCKHLSNFEPYLHCTDGFILRSRCPAKRAVPRDKSYFNNATLISQNGLLLVKCNIDPTDCKQETSGFKCNFLIWKETFQTQLAV
jgi:hypothetical protein